MEKVIRIFQITKSYLEEFKNQRFIPGLIRKRWVQEVFQILNVQVQRTGTPIENGPVIYVANHISYLDIPLLISSLTDCVFVSKDEIKKWPLFGTAAIKMGTVFVKRSCRNSRSEARTQISEQIVKHGKKIVVFPSGTTSISGEPHWKKGVFEIAESLGIPVQPIQINYKPLRKIAYIDFDFFPFHFYQLTKLKSIHAEIHFHNSILINDIIPQIEACRNLCNSEFLQLPMSKNIQTN